MITLSARLENRITEVLTRVEPVGIPGLGQKLLRSGWIVGGDRRPPVEIEGGRDDTAGDPGIPSALCLVDGVTIAGVVGGEAPRRSCQGDFGSH